MNTEDRLNDLERRVKALEAKMSDLEGWVQRQWQTFLRELDVKLDERDKCMREMRQDIKDIKAILDQMKPD